MPGRTVIETMRIYNVRRNDLLEIQGRDNVAPTFQRVMRVDIEPGQPVVVHLAGGKVVEEEAYRMVRVRRFTSLRGGSS